MSVIIGGSATLRLLWVSGHVALEMWDPATEGGEIQENRGRGTAKESKANQGSFQVLESVLLVAFSGRQKGTTQSCFCQDMKY